MRKILATTILGLSVLFLSTVTAQKHESQLIRLDKSIEPRKDSRISHYYDSINQIYQQYFNNVVAEAENYLGNKAPDGTLANVLTDELFREAAIAMSLIESSIVPDLALLNFGGIREPIPAGTITVGKIFSVLPFDNNYMVLIDIKGSKLRKMFFNNLRKIENAQSFSNVHLVYKGGIIDSVTIGGKPIDDNRLYRMATINFIENGGDKILENVATSHVYTDSQPFRTRVIEYFKAQKKIKRIKDGRVVILK